MFRVIPVVAACAFVQPALGQVYKCETNGKIEYADRPCAGGPSTTIPVPAAPANAGAAGETAQRERQALLELEKLRLSQQMREERQRALALREQRAQAREQRSLQAQQRKCARMRLHQKWAFEDRARLTGEAAEKARVKARRDAENLAVECPA